MVLFFSTAVIVLLQSCVHCPEPTVIHMSSEMSAKVDAIFKMNIAYEKKVEEIRQVLPAELQSFEVIDYRACKAYQNGLIDKQRYNELVNGVLPQFSRSATASKGLPVSAAPAGNNVMNKIFWRDIWINPQLQEYFAYDNFRQSADGRSFSIHVQKTDPVSTWGIQIIAATPIRLQDKNYVVKFEVKSSKSGAILFNIQTDNGSDMKQVFYPDQTVKLNANDIHKVRLEFHCDTFGGRLLHFKLGGPLPSDTDLVVQNIAIEQLPD